ncbi:sigma factor-like helix-turn-helix DNA-binding protein [Streptomyces bauhiniae]|uniref:sigma factor-like helix-turn-helix DNA-binding protein n=1 Tax=Streptomyces bauhiniae TaxID=2340725 RepID=UPI003317CBF1
MRTRAARRRRSFRDPTARYVGNDVLSQALLELDDAQRDLLLLRLQGAPTAQVARRLDTPRGNVEAVVAAALETLRTSGYASSLLEEMRWEHGPLRSEVVRAHSSEVVVLQRCTWTECEAIVTQPPTGRPRLYCSNACRQKAYRIRRSGREAPAVFAAQRALRRFTIRDPWADVPELPKPFAALEHPEFRRHIVPRLAAWSRGIDTSPTGARVPRSRPGSLGMAWRLFSSLLAAHGAPMGSSNRLSIDGSRLAVSPSAVKSWCRAAVLGRWYTQVDLEADAWGRSGLQDLPLSPMDPSVVRPDAARTLTSPMFLGIPATHDRARPPRHGNRGGIPLPLKPTRTSWSMPRVDRPHWPLPEPVDQRRGRTQMRMWGIGGVAGSRKGSVRNRSGRNGRRPR